MSLSSEFELAWKPFEDRIKSYIAGNTAKNTVIELDDLHSVYNQSIRMWEDHTRVQAGFLTKWRREYPELEQNMLSQLKKFSFTVPEKQQNSSPFLYISMATVCTVLGGVVGWIIPETNFLKIHLGHFPVVAIGAVIFAIVGGGIIKSIYDNSVNKNCKVIAEQYYEQLNTLHVELQDICKHYS